MKKHNMFIAIAVVVIVMPWFKACNLPCLLNYLPLPSYLWPFPK